MRFYVTTNEYRREPEALKQYNYVHIKARASGDRTLLMTKDTLNLPNVLEVTQEEAQAELDVWIEMENQGAPVDEDSGLPILQSAISLATLVVRYG